MKVVKITVLDRSLRSDLVAQYGDPALTPCPILKEAGPFLGREEAWLAMGGGTAGVS